MLTNPLLIALEASSLELQKNNALFLLKGFSVGMKLKLQSFAIAIYPQEVRSLLGPVTYNRKLPY